MLGVDLPYSADPADPFSVLGLHTLHVREIIHIRPYVPCRGEISIFGVTHPYWANLAAFFLRVRIDPY